MTITFSTLTYTNLTQNGSYFVRPTEFPIESFPTTPVTLTVTDDEGNVTTYPNSVLIHQIPLDDGYGIAFHQLTSTELYRRKIEAQLEYLAIMSDTPINL